MFLKSYRRDDDNNNTIEYQNNVDYTGKRWRCENTGKNIHQSIRNTDRRLSYSPATS